MTPMKAFIAIVIICSIILVFFNSTMVFQDLHGEKLILKVSSLSDPRESDIITTTTQKKTVHLDKNDQQGAFTISDDFRNSIPHNTAYWNRILHSRLSQLDQEDDSVGHKRGNWSACRAINLEQLLTNIQGFNFYPENFKAFLQGMECRNPQILIDQPNKCISHSGKNHTFLLFAIKSTPRHFEERQAVRETWGKEGLYEGGLRVRTVFLMGTLSADDPNLEKLLSFEAQTFGDLLQWDFRDSFFNLTLKEHAFYQWALKRCPNTAFFFKGDDDVFTNTRAVLSTLQSLEPGNVSHSYLGQIITQGSPIRDPKNKYYVPLSFYDGPYLPYAGGGGYLFSGALLPSLHQVSQYIPFFPIDDVYTGMCFHALGISARQHKGFRTFGIMDKDRENVCVHRDLLLVHERRPQEILRLWRAVHSPMLTC